MTDAIYAPTELIHCRRRRICRPAILSNAPRRRRRRRQA